VTVERERFDVVTRLVIERIGGSAGVEAGDWMATEGGSFGQVSSNSQ
jgi:hypothetical protein